MHLILDIQHQFQEMSSKNTMVRSKFAGFSSQAPANFLNPK